MAIEMETSAAQATALITRAGQSLKIRRLTPVIGAEVANH